MSLKELAKSLGLSMTTVSRALNGYPEVSEKTRQRVMGAAQQAGYRPNPVARRLASGKAEAVGFVIPSASGAFIDPFYGELLAGMGERLERDGIDLLVTASTSEAGEMRAYRRMVEAGRVDGLIVPLTRRDDPRIRYLQNSKMPFVAFGRTESAQPYAWLDVDNEAGFYEATSRLIGLGHRRIALINADLGFNFAFLRLSGYRKALQAAGIAFDADLVKSGEMSESSGAAYAQALLDMAEPPSAILCASYLAGVGVRMAIAARNLTLGRDVSLIIYRDMPREDAADDLTLLTQPMRDCGAQAADLLLALLDGAAVEGLHCLLPPALVPGGSDGPVGVIA